MNTMTHLHCKRGTGHLTGNFIETDWHIWILDSAYHTHKYCVCKTGNRSRCKNHSVNTFNMLEAWNFLKKMPTVNMWHNSGTSYIYKPCKKKNKKKIEGERERARVRNSLDS